MDQSLRLSRLTCKLLQITKGASFASSTLLTNPGKIVNNGTIISYIGSTSYIEVFFEHRGTVRSAWNSTLYSDEPTFLYPQQLNLLEGT